MGKRGRPTKRTEAVEQRVFNALAAGRSLRSVCAEKGMPTPAAVIDWCVRDPEFSDRYARARQSGLDAMAEEAVSIADDGLNDTYLDGDGNRRVDNDVVQRSRLRIETRKWFLSKLAPGKYGDRQEINLNATVRQMPQEELDARIADLLRKAGAGAPALGEPETPGEEQA